MNRQELAKHFPIEHIERAENINPLEVAEDQEFHRPGDKNFAESALNIVCEKKLPFQSTLNSQRLVVSKYLQIRCPYCGKLMKYTSSGGSGECITTIFNCNCLASFSIKIDPNNLRFYPNP